MPSENLLSELLRSRTDLARYVRSACRSDLPYIVVSTQAVSAWEQREPQTWARVRDWLAARGKTIRQV